jgi:hypothetical protein
MLKMTGVLVLFQVVLVLLLHAYIAVMRPDQALVTMIGVIVLLDMALE